MYVFNSRFNTLTVVLRPTRRVIVGTQVIKEDGISAHFERGIFTTEDEETAQLLRDKIKKTRDNSIVEIGSAEERAFQEAEKAKNIREAVTAAEVSKVAPGPKIAEASKPTTCPICDKVFKDQKSLNLHLVSHRPDVQITKPLEPAKVEEKPAAPEA